MININTEGTLNIKSTSDLIFKGVSTEVDRLRNETERAIIFYLNFIKIDKYYLITKTRFC